MLSAPQKTKYYILLKYGKLVQNYNALKLSSQVAPILSEQLFLKQNNYFHILAMKTF